MLKLHHQNLSKISADHGLKESEIFDSSKPLAQLIEKIHQRKQGFYEILDDQEILKSIEAYAQEIHSKEYQSIVVLGIGGSALGTICIQQSLLDLFAHEKGQQPKLYVLDNIDPSHITSLEELIELKDTLFIVVTKSGSTPETLSQYFYFRQKCEQAKLPIKEHFLFITDPEKGLLRETAQKEEIPSFAIPENVGGRFSVLTAVGLAPAAIMGANIHDLIKGAKETRKLFLDPDAKKNLPFQIANIQYQLSKKGKSINVMMPYAQNLISFADWYRQLLAESIGKKHDDQGNIVHTGITPVKALGATDQHSQSQLYNEGPTDKLIIFLTAKNLGPTLAIPNLAPDSKYSSYLQNTSFNELIALEHQGTAQALTENNRPNITLEIPTINAQSLGALFFLFEAATAFLGELYGINAFDQPGVELSKNITKKLLLDR